MGKTAGEEGLHIKRIMKEAMGDCSTVEEFRFLVRCRECGRTWHSSPVRFSKAGAEPKTEGMSAIFRTLYERERDAAREKAAAEASEIFSRCPVCGRLVCDRCFLICEDLDMCIACAKTLQVRGDIVAGEAFAPRELPAGPIGKASTEESDIK